MKKCKIITLSVIFCMLLTSVSYASYNDYNVIDTFQDAVLTSFFNLYETFDYDEATDTYSYPDNFAGCYVDGDILAICLKNTSEDECNEYRLRCQIDNIEIKQVNYTYGTLMDAFDACYNTFENTDGIQIMIKQTENSVKLTLPPQTARSVNTDVQDLIEEYPCIEVQYAETDAHDTAATVKGGGTLTANNQSFSAGYWAQYNNGGGYVLVTCGHPFYDDYGNKVSGSISVSSGGTSWGVTSSSFFNISTGCDAGIITRTSTSSATVTNQLNNGVRITGGTRSLLPENYTLSACYGSSTKTGTVYSTTSVYTSSATGTKITCYYVNISTTDGNSGAPYYYNYNGYNYIFGITTAKSGNGAYVSRASVINSTYGISAYTG